MVKSSRPVPSNISPCESMASYTASKKGVVRGGGVVGAIVPPRQTVDAFPLMTYVANNCAFDDDGSLEEEEFLKSANDLRFEQLLSQAALSVTEKSKESSSTDEEERKKALEVIHSLEWARNQKDTWKVAESGSKKKPDYGGFLHPLQKRDGNEEYFSGTRKLKQPRERKRSRSRSDEVMVLGDGKMVSKSSNAPLPIQITVHPRPARIPSVGLPFTPGPPLPNSESAWMQRSGSTLFSQSSSNTIVAYGISCDEEQAMALAIAESLRTAKEEQHRQINLRTFYEQDCAPPPLNNDPNQPPPADPLGTSWGLEDNEVKPKLSLDILHQSEKTSDAVINTSRNGGNSFDKLTHQTSAKLEQRSRYSSCSERVSPISVDAVDQEETAPPSYEKPTGGNFDEIKGLKSAESLGMKPFPNTKDKSEDQFGKNSADKSRHFVNTPRPSLSPNISLGSGKKPRTTSSLDTSAASVIPETELRDVFTGLKVTDYSNDEENRPTRSKPFISHSTLSDDQIDAPFVESNCIVEKKSSRMPTSMPISSKKLATNSSDVKAFTNITLSPDNPSVSDNVADVNIKPGRTQEECDSTQDMFKSPPQCADDGVTRFQPEETKPLLQPEIGDISLSSHSGNIRNLVIPINSVPTSGSKDVITTGQQQEQQHHHNLLPPPLSMFNPMQPVCPSGIPDIPQDVASAMAVAQINYFQMLLMQQAMGCLPHGMQTDRKGMNCFGYSGDQPLNEDNNGSQVPLEMNNNFSGSMPGFPHQNNCLQLGLPLFNTLPAGLSVTQNHGNPPSAKLSGFPSAFGGDISAIPNAEGFVTPGFPNAGTFGAPGFSNACGFGMPVPSNALGVDMSGVQNAGRFGLSGPLITGGFGISGLPNAGLVDMPGLPNTEAISPGLQSSFSSGVQSTSADCLGMSNGTNFNGIGSSLPQPGHVPLFSGKGRGRLNRKTHV